MKKLRLNFACGVNAWDGFENSDIEPFTLQNPRIKHVDLDKLPLPYADGCADLIMMSHGLCLRPDKFGILREFHRILKHNGWLRLDDNPYRFWIPGQTVPLEEQKSGFPERLKMSRESLRQFLMVLGFAIAEIDPATTKIHEDPIIQSLLIGNKLFHESFTIEALKVGERT